VGSSRSATPPMTLDTNAYGQLPRNESDWHAGVCCTGGSPRRSSHATTIRRSSHDTSSWRAVRPSCFDLRRSRRGCSRSARRPEAIAHFETAIGLGHPEPALLYEAIGDVRVLRGEYREALAAYDGAGAR